MTKISNQYSLTNLLTADLTNSRLGVNNTNPSYSLDLTGDARVGGSLIVTGNLTAQQFIVSSSVTFLTTSFSSGSTKFGDSSDDNHNFTGSLIVSGSATPLRVGSNLLFVSSSGNIGIGTTSPVSLLDVTSNNSGGVAANLVIKNSAGGNTSGNQGVGFYFLADGGYSVSNHSASIIALSNTRNQTGGGTDLLFATHNNSTAPTTKMTITSSGNVGIGTTSPTSYASTTLQVNGSGSSASIKLTNTSTGAGNANGLDILQSTTDTYIFNRTTGIMVFGTSDTERMRMTSGGNVLMGTSVDNGYRLRVSGGMYGNNIYLQQTTANGGGTLTLANNDTFPDSNTVIGQVNFYNTDGDIPGVAAYMRAYTGTNFGVGGQLGFGTQNTWSSGTLNQRMFIDNAGNIGAPSGTNIYNASDARLKRNIVPIENGLDKVMQLNPVKFNWIEKFVESEENKDMLGFIAQEVLPHIPEAVESFGESDLHVAELVIENPLRINEKFIIPVLVKAIQELSSANESLKNRIEVLENK
jgi:hypothetical protein